MNAYGAVILAAVLVEYALQTVAAVLGLRALDPTLPAEFRDVYDPERYRRAQEYTRVRARFGLVVATVDLLLLLGFWFAGGFAWLDRLVRGLALGPLASGLTFIAMLAVGRGLMALPFRWWSTFVIEERFGFNRTSPRTFWTDLAKGILLAALLGGPLLAAVLWLFEAGGGLAWLWAWVVTTVVLIAVQLIAPTWIMPLFNRFTPLADGALRDAILSYARTVAFPLEGVFVVDGSRRSSKANAFFTGFGRHKRVALFDTLLDTLALRQLVAVVAHEIGHWKRHHVAQGLVLAIAQTGIVFFLLSRLLAAPGLYEAFFVDTPSVYAGLVFFTLLYAPVDLALSILAHALSRRNEYAADAFAAATTGDGEGLAEGLKRLSADSLANLTPHRLDVLLHHSHPPVLARIRELRARSGAGPVGRAGPGQMC
jgi:STE24 endopeptidase